MIRSYGLPKFCRRTGEQRRLRPVLSLFQFWFIIFPKANCLFSSAVFFLLRNLRISRKLRVGFISFLFNSYMRFSPWISSLNLEWPKLFTNWFYASCIFYTFFDSFRLKIFFPIYCRFFSVFRKDILFLQCKETTQLVSNFCRNWNKTSELLIVFNSPKLYQRFVKTSNWIFSVFEVIFLQNDRVDFFYPGHDRQFSPCKKHFVI